ncbi:MAG: protein dehydratase [Pseudomonadales bacterium]|jgi:acyl dehydratase|uniref:MaoC family dehydratase n=1 Tax=unclassified Ketobacter TaxID=2639109 RepID=UPI000C49A471|nr:MULTISPECIES: MaoC family dehydratase [unclassified Ketobacter]MAQ25858.1 protein dehydratase [Pseudomonadales bacterium]MEC8810921.1 MaoC family dehydratase [Pseudomonadota bacterium]HAG96907.1 protein dehydratase [Gammaproteobacteria bacterium]MBI28039.1 protein dehydratase [Pseudomonadales bacterium]RLT88962.1 MAG: MaoC family dehydratase [Ketobacter sp. GenoA1]|tara:strand:- start:1056 stop:1517 length:462 start_codon:yes stop_codon:yes gene_type:complete
MKIVDAASLQDYVGRSMGQSEWFQIDQERINAFADSTLDHQFIHVDPEQAKHTPFGGTIAHGFLTLSLLPHLQSQMSELVIPAGLKMGMNYGFDKIRFLAPVKTGARVRAVATLKAVTEKNPGQYLFTAEYAVEIEGESKPALIADWLVMYFV